MTDVSDNPGVEPMQPAKIKGKRGRDRKRSLYKAVAAQVNRFAVGCYSGLGCILLTFRNNVSVS